MHRMVGKFLFYFSLIELLIVIAVISILVSLLLPALNSARDRARQIFCAANAKQFGLAMVQYAGDNRDYQPGFDEGLNTKIKMRPQFVSKLHPYLVKGEIPVNERLNKVFFCPAADDQSCWWGSSTAGRGLETEPLTSYAWNAFAGYGTSEFYAQRLLTKCKLPSEIAIKQSCINLYCNIEKVWYVICNSNRRGTDEDNSYSNNGPGTSKVAGIAPKVRRLPQ